MLLWLLFSVFLTHASSEITRITRHEIGPDGDLRWVECDNIEACMDQGFSTPGMALHRTWTEKLEKELRKRLASIERSSSNRSSAFSRQSRVRRIIRGNLLHAGFPRTPPIYHVVREFDDQERGVRVHLLYFEAWPGHSVPAVFFLPLSAQRGDRLAGILHLTGHLAQGFRDPAEQRLSLGLAQQGFAVLSFDPLSQGERQQYGKDTDRECGISCDDSSCSSIGPACSAAHNHFGRQLWLLGKGAAEVFVEDSLRALDLLASLPSIDPDRLGAVGCSGGGMLTAYLGAVDPRIKASCIACYFSTLEMELERGTCNYDAEQILWRQVTNGIDKPDMLIARAPLSTLVLVTSHDCFPLAGARAGFGEATAAFGAHFPPYHTDMGFYRSESLGYHGVTATGIEGIHTLFRERLMVGSSNALPFLTIPPSQFSPVPVQKLMLNPCLNSSCSASLSNHSPSYISDLIRVRARPLLRRLRRLRQLASVGLDAGWLKNLDTSSARIAGMDIASIGQSFAHMMTEPVEIAKVKTTFYSMGLEEWYLLYTNEKHCSITLRVFRMTNGTHEGAVLWITDESHMNRPLNDREATALNALGKRGIDMVIAGLCGLGDTLWKGGLWDYAPLLLGKTHVSLHADEILRVIAWMFSTLGVARLVLAAVEDMVAAVLHAAIHVPKLLATPGNDFSKKHAIKGVALVRSICCFAGVVSTSHHYMPWQMQMYGVLNNYDLPDLLAGLTAQSQVSALVVEPRDARKRPLSWREAIRVYRFPQRLHASSHSTFKLLVGRRSPDSEGRALASFADDLVSN